MPADVVLDAEDEFDPDLPLDAAVGEAFPFADDPVPDAFVELPDLPVAVVEFLAFEEEDDWVC